MLELRGIVKQYSYGKRLFGAVDLTLKDGEILSVLGGEGSGKTSLLKAICGIDSHEGVITLDGKELKSKTDDVIMVFDDGALFPTKTVFDNLAYPLKVRKVNKVEIASKVISVAEKLGIVALLKARPRSLTAVEKRKVSLGRILMRDARLILLDDLIHDLPVDEADALFDDLSRLLYSLAKDKGVSIIYVTDKPRYAFSIADKTMVLVGGDVKQIGTYSDMWFFPDTLWSAQAADEHYNALKGVLNCGNDRLTFCCEIFGQNFDFDVTTQRSKISSDFFGKTVYMGWHAEDTVVASSGVKMQVKFVSSCKDKFALEGADSLDKITLISDSKMNEVSFLPDVDKVQFFDVNENSIMKRI